MCSTIRMRRPNRGRAMPRSPREVHVFGAVASRFETLPITFAMPSGSRAGWRTTATRAIAWPIAQALENGWCW